MRCDNLTRRSSIYVYISIGMIQVLTNQQVGLNVITELISRTSYRGQLVAKMSGHGGTVHHSGPGALVHIGFQTRALHEDLSKVHVLSASYCHRCRWNGTTDCIAGRTAPHPIVDVHEHPVRVPHILYRSLTMYNLFAIRNIRDPKQRSQIRRESTRWEWFVQEYDGNCVPTLESGPWEFALGGYFDCTDGGLYRACFPDPICIIRGC